MYLVRAGFLLFFFQAEDGIRDHCVTGVQTCALPILALSRNELVVMKIPFRLLAGQCTDERLNFRPTARIKTFALQIRTIPSHIAALSQQTNNCGSLPL